MITYHLSLLNLPYLLTSKRNETKRNETKRNETKLENNKNTLKLKIFKCLMKKSVRNSKTSINEPCDGITNWRDLKTETKKQTNRKKRKKSQSWLHFGR